MVQGWRLLFDGVSRLSGTPAYEIQPLYCSRAQLYSSTPGCCCLSLSFASTPAVAMMPSWVSSFVL